MDLLLAREKYSSKSTVGGLLVNKKFLCNTLEDVVRDKNRDGDLLDTGEAKVYGQTAIPSGKYEVVITYSQRFKKYMPLLLNVAGYAGVRIHSGNKPEDTLGCILVGTAVGNDWISESRNAYEALMKQLQAAEKSEKIFLTIVDLPAQKAA